MAERSLSHNVNIGLRVAQYGTDWHTLVAHATHAEQRGFASLWVNDHLRTPGRLVTTPAFDAFTTLAGLATRTHRADLGIAVASASYRPAPLGAKMATAIDNISQGRLVLGLGTGSDRAEHDAYGVPFGNGVDRAEQLESAFSTMREMFDAPDGASVAGALVDAQNLPPPAQPRLPIWIAANKGRLLRFAGEHADGLVVAFADPDGVSHRLEQAREVRGDRPMRCALYTYVVPVESPQETHAWLAPEAEALGTSPRKLLRWIDGTGLVGDPTSLREQVAAFAAVGVTDLICVMPNRTPLDAIDGLADALLGQPPREEPPQPPTRSARHSLADLLVQSHRRDGRGSDPAVIQGNDSWTFDQLADDAGRAAATLRARGVRRGDRVAIAVRDGIDWVRGFLGTMWLGAVAVPLDPRSPTETLRDIVDDCEPLLVLMDEATSELAGAPLLRASELLTGSQAVPVTPVEPEDLAYLIYSSGSTGRPKAAMHAHDDPAVSVATYATEILNLQPGDRCHSVARLFTSLGFGNGFFRPLGKGAAIVLSSERPNPRSVLERVDEHGVTVLTGVPTFWSQLVRFLERHPVDGGFANLRLLASSGDGLPASVADAVRDATGLPVVNGLGCSECSNIIISWRDGEHLTGTLGRAIGDVEIKLADADGAPVHEGDPGRLWIRSESNTSGYWRRRDLTRELVYGPWIRMGDMLVEQDGVYRHVGRIDAMFKVDGKWVSPPDVEAALISHPAVEDAAVVGRPDDWGLIRSSAFVVLRDGLAEDGPAGELRAHLVERVPLHMVPKQITFLRELPRLPSGKIARGQL